MKKIQSLLLTAALFGCDTTTSPGQDMTPVVVTPEQACPDLIKAYCAKAAECFPFNQGLAWPDAATCAARLNLSCPQLAKLTGSSVTGADLMACTPKFASLSCTDYFSQTSQIQVCGFKPGTLADGTACGEDVQCQSLYCKKRCGHGLRQVYGARQVRQRLRQRPGLRQGPGLRRSSWRQAVYPLPHDGGDLQHGVQQRSLSPYAGLSEWHVRTPGSAG